MQLFSKLVLAVLLAHLLADFPLQTSSIVQGKSRGIRAYFLHCLIHLLSLLVCIALFVGLAQLASPRFWIAALVYLAVHFAIDFAKHRLVSSRKLRDSASAFVLDQALHLITIFAFAWFLARPGWAALRSQLQWAPATADRALQAAVVYVAVMFAGGYLIRYLTRGLTVGMKSPGETPAQVKNAGLYIGWLERFLVVTAILVQSPSMIGLILTGKSIARFPELRKDDQQRFAEYFLIGTMLSISVAVLGGLLLARLWYGSISLK